MPESKLDLIESRDSWQQCADHDKGQAINSFVLSNIGASIGSIGLLATAIGRPIIGIPAMVVGGGFSYFSNRSARSEIDSAMEMQGKAAVRQYQIDNNDEERKSLLPSWMTDNDPKRIQLAYAKTCAEWASGGRAIELEQDDLPEEFWDDVRKKVEQSPNKG